MEAQARLRAAIAVDHFPAIPAGRQVPRQRPRRIRFYVQCTRLDRHVAHLAPVPPDAVDRIPVVLPGLAQQFPAQPLGGDPLAFGIDGDDLDSSRLPFRHRLVAVRGAQPDRQRTLSDRPRHRFGHGAPARLDDADAHGRGERLRQVGKIAQRQRDGRFAVAVGRRRIDVLPRPGELLGGQAELKAGLVRERVLVEGDRRLRLNRQFRPGRAVVVARLDVDRELPRPARSARRRRTAPLSAAAARNPRRGIRPMPIGGAFGSRRNSTRQLPIRASRARL